MQVSIRDKNNKEITKFYTSWSPVEGFQFAKIWAEKFNRMVDKNNLKGPKAFVVFIGDQYKYLKDSNS